MEVIDGAGRSDQVSDDGDLNLGVEELVRIEKRGVSK